MVSCKVIILGDNGVGKKSLMYRFCREDFTTHNSIIVTNFESKSIKLFDKTVKIKIWVDEENVFAATRLYLRNAMGVVFVYDVTRPETLFNMEKWFNVVAEKASSDVIKVLVGHKCDDRNSKIISTQEGKAVADNFKMRFFEASSKEDNKHIYPIFASIAQDLYFKNQEKSKCKMDAFSSVFGNNNNQTDSSWFNSMYDYYNYYICDWFNY